VSKPSGSLEGRGRLAAGGPPARPESGLPARCGSNCGPSGTSSHYLLTPQSSQSIAFLVTHRVPLHPHPSHPPPQVHLRTMRHPAVWTTIPWPASMPSAAALRRGRPRPPRPRRLTGLWSFAPHPPSSRHVGVVVRVVAPRGAQLRVMCGSSTAAAGGHCTRTLHMQPAGTHAFVLAGLGVAACAAGLAPALVKTTTPVCVPLTSPALPQT
jgi:hypothetical protein